MKVMTNYIVIKKSYSYLGELSLGKPLKINKNEIINIYDLAMQKIFITNKVYKKYLKLLKLVNFYLNSEDDTGTAYHEALNEIEKFRQLVKNKYRAYLLEKELKEMSLELSKKVKVAKDKLVYLNVINMEYINENRRSR